MMPYIMGVDPENNEIIVGFQDDFVFFLRGPSMEERRIRDLVQHANEGVHGQLITDAQIEAILELTCFPPIKDDQWEGAEVNHGTTETLGAKIRKILARPCRGEGR